MREEVFGPILPVVTTDSLDGMLAQVRSRPAPLAVYVFAGDRRTRRALLGGTVSGGACVNDTLLQTSLPAAELCSLSVYFACRLTN